MLGSHWSTPGGRQPRFIVGANLPWIDYGADFGASRWHPEGGLSIRPSALAKLEQALATLERDRVSFIRVFRSATGDPALRSMTRACRQEWTSRSSRMLMRCSPPRASGAYG